MIHYMLLLGYLLVTCHKNNIVTLHVTFMLYRRNKTCLLGILRQVLANGREVASPAMRDAASEQESLGLYKSQSQTKWSLTCSEQSYRLIFCHLSGKTTRPLPKCQAIVRNNSMGYLLASTRSRQDNCGSIKVT